MLGLADRSQRLRPVRDGDEGRRGRGAGAARATLYRAGADPLVVAAGPAGADALADPRSSWCRRSPTTRACREAERARGQAARRRSSRCRCWPRLADAAEGPRRGAGGAAAAGGARDGAGPPGPCRRPADAGRAGRGGCKRAARRPAAAAPPARGRRRAPRAGRGRDWAAPAWRGRGGRRAAGARRVRRAEPRRSAGAPPMPRPRPLRCPSRRASPTSWRCSRRGARRMLHAHLRQQRASRALRAGRIELRPADGAPRDLADAADGAARRTGPAGAGSSPSRARASRRSASRPPPKRAAQRGARAQHPLVRAVLDAFPGRHHRGGARRRRRRPAGGAAGERASPRSIPTSEDPKRSEP